MKLKLSQKFVLHDENSLKNEKFCDFKKMKNDKIKKHFRNFQAKIFVVLLLFFRDATFSYFQIFSQ